MENSDPLIFHCHPVGVLGEVSVKETSVDGGTVLPAFQVKDAGLGGVLGPPPGVGEPELPTIM